MLRVLFALVLFALSPVAAAQVEYRCAGSFMQVIRGGSVLGQVSWDRRAHDFSVSGRCDSECMAQAASCSGVARRLLIQSPQLGYKSVSTPVGSVSHIGGRIFITVSIVMLAGIGIWFSLFSVGAIRELLARLSFFRDNEGVGGYEYFRSKDFEFHDDADGSLFVDDESRAAWKAALVREGVYVSVADVPDDVDEAQAARVQHRLATGEARILTRGDIDGAFQGLGLQGVSPAPVGMWNGNDLVNGDVVCDECGYSASQCVCADRA